MISRFNLSSEEWKQTPQQVRIAAVSLQHQLYTLNARLSVYQKQGVNNVTPT